MYSNNKQFKGRDQALGPPNVASDPNPDEILNAYLDYKSREYGYSAEAAQRWKHYMLDTSRGEDIFNWMSAIGACDPSSRVLEVGCGFGTVTEGVARHVHSIYGVEILEDRTRLVQKRLNHLAEEMDRPFIGGATVGNCSRLPFASSSFDFVICNDVLEHIPKDSQSALFAEIDRVLEEGGTLFLTVSNRLQLRDNHNDHLPLATWLPGPLRQTYFQLFAYSENFLLTWDPTSFELIQLASQAGFQRFDKKPLWRFAIRNLFQSVFTIILQKQ